jgi:hypothetical protein
VNIHEPKEAKAKKSLDVIGYSIIYNGFTTVLQVEGV